MHRLLAGTTTPEGIHDKYKSRMHAATTLYMVAPPFGRAAIATSLALLIALAARFRLTGLTPAAQTVAAGCVRRKLYRIFDLLQATVQNMLTIVPIRCHVSQATGDSSSERAAS